MRLELLLLRCRVGDSLHLYLLLMLLVLHHRDLLLLDGRGLVDLLRCVLEFLLQRLRLVRVVEVWWRRGARRERGVGVWACVDGGGEGLGGVGDLAVGHGAGNVGLYVEIWVGVHGGDAGVVLF